MRFVNLLVVLILSSCTPNLDNRLTSPIVQEIFRTVQPEIEKSGYTYKDPLSPDERNAIAQAVFLRPAGQERQCMGPIQKFSTYSNQLYPLFKSLGDVDTVYPKQLDYDYILINGSTVRNMRERVKTLINLVDSGKIIMTPKTQIVFLSGDRDLFSEDKEGSLQDTQLLGCNPQFKTIKLPKTEYEAAIWIWQQANLPEELRATRINFINAPKIKTTDKSGRIKFMRPTTATTVKKWLESSPKPGSCLCISSQPFVYYQTLTTSMLLNADSNRFQVDGTGESASEPETKFSKQVDVVMDNLARTIYTHFHTFKMKVD